MIKRKSKDNVQARSYHTDRFYRPISTDRLDPKATPFCEVYLFVVDRANLLSCYVELGQMVMLVDKSAARVVLSALISKGYGVLCDMSAIDNLAVNGTMELFYQVLSHSEDNKDRRRIRVKCSIADGESMDSVSDLYSCAEWSERECYDMLGIRFNNHPCMKRIIMPSDWVGHPLRKNYPLKGDEAASWYEVDKIFGYEYRSVIGPEQRDSARVDFEDTINYSRIGMEVPFGTCPKDSKTEVLYQEAKKPPVVRRIKSGQTKKLDKRI